VIDNVESVFHFICFLPVLYEIPAGKFR
jgi:hypothetical protein